jgi:hypothetical protein
MYKALCVAVLLLSTFAVAQGHKAATPPFPSPLIVAKAKLANQTAPIPTTTIFTPIQDGLYRLSVYATLVDPGQSNGAWWAFNLAWTDDAGSQTIGSFLVGYDIGATSIGQFVQLWNAGFNVSMGGPVTTFEAKAGQPITYSVTQPNGTDNSKYSLYYTLERLE